MVGASVVPLIGARLRAARLRRGISVRGLAREVGVSASLISQLETDRSSPSVSTLYGITTVLGISIEELFGAESPAPVLAAAAVPVDRPPASGSLRERRVGPVTTPAQREGLALDSGVTWELLGQIPGTQVDFLRITYQPGGMSSSTGLLMRHTGAEFGYLLSGELVLTLGTTRHPVRAGDSVSFEAATPHSYRNEGTEPAVGVWCVLERFT